MGFTSHIFLLKSFDLASIETEVVTKEEFKIAFGKHLEKLRSEQNLTYRALSERCNIDYSDINKYEKGKKDLQLGTVLELSKGLNIHPKELFDFEIIN